LGLEEGVVIDMSLLEQWIGREEVIEDTITATPIRGMSATIDRGEANLEVGDPIPIPWHWLYFLPSPLASELSDDGHPKRGGFLPPVPLPKRMWAGGSIEIIAAPKIGDWVKRVSTISDVTHKSGATGELVFVTVKHEIYAEGQLAITDRQDLVYRESPTADTPVAVPRPAPAGAMWSSKFEATPPLLFRYSALTFNSHRIHYDKDYTVNVEGYADLVVQGPLLATLLLDLLSRERPLSQLKRFDYRAVRPLLANNTFWVEGNVETDGGAELNQAVSKSNRQLSDELVTSKLWVRDHANAITMSATAFFVEN
jgi:3-methylfumaryl-CoA hydratase